MLPIAPSSTTMREDSASKSACRRWLSIAVVKVLLQRGSGDGRQRQIHRDGHHGTRLVQRVEVDSRHAEADQPLTLLGGVVDTEIEGGRFFMLDPGQQLLEPRRDSRPAERGESPRLSRRL